MIIIFIGEFIQFVVKYGTYEVPIYKYKLFFSEIICGKDFPNSYTSGEFQYNIHSISKLCNCCIQYFYFLKQVCLFYTLSSMVLFL